MSCLWSFPLFLSTRIIQAKPVIKVMIVGRLRRSVPFSNRIKKLEGRMIKKGTQLNHTAHYEHVLLTSLFGMMIIILSRYLFLFWWKKIIKEVDVVFNCPRTQHNRGQERRALFSFLCPTIFINRKKKDY